MTAASLSLLKGGSKAKAAPAAPISVDAEMVVFDPDTCTEPELEAFVLETFGTKPPSWSKMSFDAKKKWVISQAEDDSPPFDMGEQAAPVQANLKLEDKLSETAAKVADTVKKAVDELHADEASKELVAQTKYNKKSKTKTSATGVVTKSVAAEIVSADPLADMVHEIENLTEDEAKDRLSNLTNTTEASFFKMGGVLSVIQQKGWFGGHATLKDYVEKEHGINYRRAMYWIAIYRNLVEADVPWEKVQGLGWTKLTVIAEVLTVTNVDMWVEQAKTKTVLQLADLVKNSKAPQLTDGTTEKVTDEVKTKTFKLHPGQKETVEIALDKAKKDSNTTVDTVALEAICLDYISAPSLAQKLKQVGLDAAIAALKQAFPDLSIEL